jgi:acetolactate synthase-1/2/3 large subunit
MSTDALIYNVKSSQVDTIQCTGATAILDAIVSEGATLVFGYPGGAIMPVYDALVEYSDCLGHILVRHEQGAIHAAQGYSRVSGKTGIVIATSGPGATNLVTGLADALIDSTPIVCITGQVFSHLLGTDAFQETDVINVVSPVTKWCYQITRASEVPEVLAKAFYIASSGRPGPVVIDVTKDAQLQTFDYAGYSSCQFIRSYKPKPSVRPQYIEEAARLIEEAERPLVIFGQGVILGNAEAEFSEFIEKGNLPAAWTILGMGAIPTDHPLAAGMLGMHGNYAPNLLTNECDVLIAVGMRFDDRVTGKPDKYAQQAKIIHLDIDPAEIDKIIRTNVAVWGDCKETLPMLTQRISHKNRQAWLDRFASLFKQENEKIIIPEQHPQCEFITMGEVIRELNELTEGNAIFVTDVGQHQMVTCRYAHIRNSRSNITSGGLGTMGFGLPAAIGAKYGAPERTVIAVIGDGGIQMTIQELGTIMQECANQKSGRIRPDIKIVILNNHYLGMVRQWQELFHQQRYSFVDIKSPDYVKLAEAYQITGASIRERGELKEKLSAMISHKGPFLMEIHVGKENNVFPMIPQGKGIGDIVLSVDQLNKMV